MKKVIFLVSILSFILLISVGCSKKQEDSAEGNTENDVLRVGMELKYPPFEYKTEQGEPVGASVDLANALGEYLNRKVEIVDTPYSSLIPALETNQIDIIISSMTITEERQKVVDFSMPYTTSQLMMLVNKDSKVKSVEDLNDPSVVIINKTGTIGSLWAMSNAPEATIKNVEEEATAVLEVSRGSADVFIYDPLSIIRHHENYKDSTRAILEALPNTQGWGVALPKGSEDLKNKIDAFIKEAKTNGIYDEIREKHLKEKIEEFKKYNLEFFF